MTRVTGSRACGSPARVACQVLLRPGDAVVVEEPTYNLALDLFRALGTRVVTVPVDSAGMQVDLLEPVLQTHHPRMVYTIPNFQNPSGASMSGPRRARLLALADRYNVPVVEDDYVGDLRYEGRSPPAVKALDTNGQVIYLGTFSKLLMPGLRWATSSRTARSTRGWPRTSACRT